MMIFLLFLFFLFFHYISSCGPQYSSSTTVSVSNFSSLICAINHSVPIIQISSNINFQHTIVVQNQKSRIQLIGSEGLSFFAPFQLFNLSHSNFSITSISLVQYSPIPSQSEVYGGIISLVSSELSLHNVIFKNGYASCGAGIYSVSSTLLISNSLFLNNTISKSTTNLLLKSQSSLDSPLLYSCGGAISSMYGSLQVIHSNFSLNYGLSGGAISLLGTISSISKSMFVDNAANLFGGALSAAKSSSSTLPLTLSSTSFSSNRASTNAGAISIVETLVSITSLNCVGNVVSGSKFSSSTYGGCLRSSSGAHVTCSNCLLQGNSVQNGGAVAASASYVHLVNSLLLDNQAQQNGGAISGVAGGTVVLSGGSVQNNYALNGGSWDISQGTALTISKTEFRNNSVSQCLLTDSCYSGQGGLGYCQDSFVTISSSQVSQSYGSVAGIIAAYSCSLSLTGLRFSDCVSEQSGIQANSNSSLFVSNSLFERMNSSTSGAAITCILTKACHIFNTTFKEGFISDEGAVLSFSQTPAIINQSTFLQNFGNSSGGAISSTNSQLLILDSIFKNNFVLSNGGAIYISDSSSLDLQRCYFSENFADSGGAIFIDFYSQLNIDQSIFHSNNASNQGGSIGIQVGSSGVIRNSVFSGGSASEGGAIFSASHATLTLQKVDGFENSVSFGGGFLSVFQHSKASLTECHLRENSGHLGGALLLQDSSSISLVDSTLENNFAIVNGGGALLQVSCELLVNRSIFSSNFAKSNGGVFSLTDASIIVQNSSFHSNAATLGAVLSASASQTIRFDSCLFDANGLTLTTVDQLKLISFNGGVMLADSNSMVHTSNSIFHRNSASSIGGVFVLTTGARVVSVNDRFISNIAITGGVFYSLGNSTITIINGNFTSNSAFDGTAGAIFVDQGTLSISSSVFVSNKASSNGGAIYAVDSHLSISDSSFLSNQSPLYGGAIFLMSSKTPSPTPTGTFQPTHRPSPKPSFAPYSAPPFLSHMSSAVLDESLAIDIEAASDSPQLDGLGLVEQIQSWADLTRESQPTDPILPSLEDLSSSHRRLAASSLQISQSTFSLNVAGGSYGGGIFIQNYLSPVNFMDCLFSGNQAKSYGGGIYSTGTTVNIDSSTFTENSVQIGGGGVYWVYSPTALVTISPNTFARSKKNFAGYGNFTATNTVRMSMEMKNMSMESGAVSPKLVSYLYDVYSQGVLVGPASTIFVIVQPYNKSATVSGSTLAFSKGGKASFPELVITGRPGSTCTLYFIASLSISPIQLLVTFVDCVAGQILEKVPGGSSSESYFICSTCPAGTFSLSTLDSSCTRCPSNAFCPGGSLIDVDPGFYRESNSTNEVMICPVPQNCLGGTNPATQCAQNHYGPYCALCEPGYFNSAGNCVSCGSKSELMVGSLPFIFILFFFIIAAFFYRTMIAFVSKVKNYFNAKIKFRKMGVKLKILVGFYQILSQMSPALNLVFPMSFARLTNLLSFINIDFWTYAACSIHVNFFRQLVFITLGPPLSIIGLYLLLMALALYARRMNSRRPFYPLKRVQKDLISYCLILSYVVLAPVSIKIFQALSCATFPSGDSYLNADLSYSCLTWEYRVMKLYANVMILVYPVGIPLLYTIILCYFRKMINPHWTMVVGRDEAQIISEEVLQTEKTKIRNTYRQIQNFKFLYGNYKPRWWYIEIFDCVRRLCLTAVPVLIYRGSVMQIVVVLLIALAAIAVMMYTEPYTDKQDNQLATVAYWSIALTFIGSLILRVGASSSSSDRIGIVLVILNVGVTILAVASSLVSAKQSLTEEKETEEKEIHVLGKQARQEQPSSGSSSSRGQSKEEIESEQQERQDSDWGLEMSEQASPFQDQFHRKGHQNDSDDEED